MSDDVEITRGGAELLGELRPLWLALRTHHGEIAPQLGPVRDDEDTWRRRRAQYAEWLQNERNFVLLARRRGRALGYLFARVAESASATWNGGTVLDVETLSVLPEARGSGIGARLLALVREEVAVRGYDQLTLTAVATNRDALRFYEREGFAPTFVTLRDTRRTR
ncbi:MAG TPA: GNAT family N-acetyltransferase [Baekduia sp.]|nr:GNAT family N-acetyltransferase [Baekduia sp.]